MYFFYILQDIKLMSFSAMSIVPSLSLHVSEVIPLLIAYSVHEQYYSYNFVVFKSQKRNVTL